jgi:predicted nucleic acid-binding protein
MRFVVLDTDVSSQVIKKRLTGPLGSKLVGKTWCVITPRPVNDSWIAACCLSYDVPLATLNTKDFVDFVQRDGLRLL